MRNGVCIGLLAPAVLAACASFPELDAAISPEARRADYPRLVPTEQLLVKRSEGRITETTGPELQARAANLQARARLLRGQPIDKETRIRLRSRLRRLGG